MDDLANLRDSRGLRAMKKILPILTAAAMGAFALPASATDFIGKSNIDFFYAELEGGYAVFSGAPLNEGASPELQPPAGAYGTALLGHVSIDDGIIGGYVDRAELWFSYFDHGDDTDAGGNISFDRNYWEVGTRFQHYYDQNAANKMMWGFEPFYGEFSATANQVAPVNRGVIDQSIYGAMLSFESERMISPSTMLLLRAAGGVYGSSADYNLTGGTTASDSDTTAGFRGQLAIGLKRQLNARTSVGVIGRVDYFSAVAVPDLATGNTTLRNDGLVDASIGINLNYIFAGIYE